jgi:TonB-dependent receptor-like protein
VNAKLAVEMASQVVTVSGERSLGEVEAIDIERTADNIVQVLPSQIIMSLPNTNIADAVGRLPSVSLERDEGEGKYVQIRGTEPRLSNVTIDGVNIPSPEGNVRNIKLDIVPSSLVDRIEVFKTLSANQDGDAIGGTVNLVTRTPADRPTIDFEGQGAITDVAWPGTPAPSCPPNAPCQYKTVWHCDAAHTPPDYNVIGINGGDYRKIATYVVWRAISPCIRFYWPGPWTCHNPIPINSWLLSVNDPNYPLYACTHNP